ncbi:hypothetical protein [Sulfitobacter sp. R18_1]|uniref:hypothetical protein n=1 Tax=Sulfitobacter sp. R18_1 TaxID=2821104 RepID=UPI001ADCBB72|nr:hypothetical protein [Sulfitobacter sp. R18_1]MBO9431602.1 hypothetical protein [Sulfitobacter sp. R18_1]
MMPGCYDWPAQYSGDTAWPFTLVFNKYGEPTDLSGAVIKMQVRNSRTGAVVLELTSAVSAGIDITSVTKGEATIGNYEVPDVPGVHVYDLQIIFPDNVVRTYLHGHYPIHKQVTT